MSEISIMPAPVAAEISGAGSFFGSCQIASGNFEAFLQSASEAQTAGYGALAMPTIANNATAATATATATAVATEGNLDADSEAETETGELLPEMFFEIISSFSDNHKSNEVLAKLQEVLGEEAGAEAFETIKNFIEKYEPLMPKNYTGFSADSEVSDALKIISHLMKSLDPKYMAETPIETQEAELLNILEDIEIFEEVKTTISGKEQKPQPQPKVEVSKHQPQYQPQPQPEIEVKVEIAQPKAEIPQPEIEIEMPQPKAETQPKAEISQPEIEVEVEMPQPKAEISQPEIEVEMPQPKAEVLQPEIEVETEIAQPKAEMPQQEMKAAQPAQPAQPAPQTQATQQAQPEIEEEASSIDLLTLYLLKKLGLKSPEDEEGNEDDKKFFDFLNDLVKKGLIDLDDFDLYDLKALVMEGEEKELNFFEKTLKELWECVKSGDEPRKREILSMFKQLADTKETVKELKQVSNTVKTETPNKKEDLNLDFVPKTSEASKNSETPKISEAAKIAGTAGTNGTNENPETPELSKNSKDSKDSKVSKTPEERSELEFASLEPAKSKQSKQGEGKQAPVQPEVRAVWEGSTLKVEIVNPKTGEKLQTVEAAMPQRMQEKIHEFEVVKQIAAQARFTTTPTGEQKLTIQLRPEHLGQVDLRITLNHGEMQIHARVESTTAQNALESHIGLLREGLEKHGINLERLEVSVEQKDKQDAYSLAERQEQQEQRQRNRKHRRGREMHLAVSVKNDANSDTGRRLGYNTMEYLA
jgi:flagellar hook-length control protein FliK